MKRIEVRAPAKVNTLLRVIGRRADGYHDLEMVMLPLSLADELTLEESSGGVDIVIDGQSDPGMQGEKNLASRAALAIREIFSISAGLKISLQKKIPVAAGLGGGSSDAAAVLRGLNEMWQLGLENSELAAIGSKLGADVPFFCYGGPAFVEGIGDVVTPYTSFPNISILMVNPNFAISTPWVYQQYDLQLTEKGSNARVRPHFQVFSDVVANLHNDLESVTIKAHSEIAEIKRLLVELGAAGAMMSGSGPTVFGVFENSKSRDSALAAMPENGWRLFAAEGVVPTKS
ncbi:MAG TPA: 4-(cytidine 5'-diphospho)-2-C-methyl-D-erythritol kinase [bacterium]|nr:4-(cytidine 5'-diphospho)-2-C-methyl-D-erythritol kinase [Myxococcales bacterium]OQA59336.1 MAG: 4-diphosphocytidyl-2-C-methyl-D-erythritol kinase [bacterium ADurb.Bin270]HPW44757.1 4-(cytidine 5'-diphospho)-2-C-methyl-D-erythritol kinase [bacterium]HQC50188.1 4-(cytidine 5'-diphospho)-2-C-methyl-D-erythritol kinase [bacterium]HQG13071.1 4-(cytidine 5'-diphospho)-2-C-methyl-D-erythritol kinase [bacterium]